MQTQKNQQQKKKENSFSQNDKTYYENYNQILNEVSQRDSNRTIYGKSIQQQAQRYSKFVPNKYAEELKQLLIKQFDLLEDQKQFLLEEVENKLKEIRKIAFYKAKATKIDGMFVGIWIGISISMFLLLMIIISIFNLSIEDDSRFSRDFPIWRGIAIFIWYVWILGFNMWLYQKYRLDYRKIFRFTQDHYPQAVNVFKFAGFHTSAFLVLFLLYVFSYANIYKLEIFEQEYFALACWVIFFASLVLPLPAFSNKGRFYAFKLFFEALLSPFTGINFAVLWMIDQFVSMAIPLKDMSYTYCYYTQANFESTTNQCQDSNRAFPILTLGVSACSYKIFQCLRQGYEKKKYFLTPPFYNTLKLSTTIIATVLAYQYRTVSDSYFVPWLLIAIISTIYSYIWDIIMDWGLLQKNNKNPYLRETLIIPYKNIYWIVIVLNFLMRIVWILTLSPVVSSFFGNINLFNLLIGVIQILRRGIWNFFKLQKQHLNRQQADSSSSTMNQPQIIAKQQKIKINYNKLQFKLIKFYQKFSQTLKNTGTQPNEQQQKYNLTKLQLIDIQQIQQISQLMNQAYKLNPRLKTKLSLQDKRESIQKFNNRISLPKEYQLSEINKNDKKINIQLDNN